MASEYQKFAIPHPQWIDVRLDALCQPSRSICDTMAYLLTKMQFPTNLPAGTRLQELTRDCKPIAPTEDLDIVEHEFPTRDDDNIKLRSYKRKPNGEKPAPTALPLYIFMHGGGFTNGSLDTEDKTCRRIAREIDICVLSIEYRLAPEKQFPVGFEDCWEVLKWVGTQDA